MRQFAQRPRDIQVHRQTPASEAVFADVVPGARVQYSRDNALVLHE
jgi:hypothetical protein